MHMEMMPPRPMDRMESVREVFSASSLSPSLPHFLAEEEACR